MLDQFRNVLASPKPSQQTYLKKVQDTMLNTMQTLLPQDFDFSQLAKIFQKQFEYENLASLTYKLTQYFVKIFSSNFISQQSYFSLQQQTQKLQSTIRGHIKQMEQQMKMYLQHLEYKIQRYEYHLKKLRRKHHDNIDSSNQLKEHKDKDNIDQLKKRQTQLLKERLILLRKCDHLQRRMKDQQIQLRRLHSPTSATIQQIKQGLILKQKEISESKSNTLLNPQQFFSKQKQQTLDRRLSSYSMNSDHQVTQKKTSIPMSSVHQNYRLYSLAGKDQIVNSLSNFASIQYLEKQTIKEVQMNQNQKHEQQDESRSPIYILEKFQ